MISFLFLLTVLGYCAMAGAKTTYFKSEVAGQDLPFSDAALVGDTLYISGKGGVLPGTRTVPEDPKEDEFGPVVDQIPTLQSSTPSILPSALSNGSMATIRGKAPFSHACCRLCTSAI